MLVMEIVVAPFAFANFVLSTTSLELPEWLMENTTSFSVSKEVEMVSLRLSQAWVQNLTIKMWSRCDELCRCVSSGTVCSFFFFFNIYRMWQSL